MYFTLRVGNKKYSKVQDRHCARVERAIWYACGAGPQGRCVRGPRLLRIAAGIVRRVSAIRAAVVARVRDGVAVGGAHGARRRRARRVAAAVAVGRRGPGIALVARSGGRDGHALLLEVEQALARELAAMHALGHAQVVREREQVEGVPEGDRPFDDG